jgi:predicted RNase H-like nuclease (RuvC/YqgF family)
METNMGKKNHNKKNDNLSVLNEEERKAIETIKNLKKEENDLQNKINLKKEELKKIKEEYNQISDKLFDKKMEENNKIEEKLEEKKEEINKEVPVISEEKKEEKQVKQISGGYSKLNPLYWMGYGGSSKTPITNDNKETTKEELEKKEAFKTLSELQNKKENFVNKEENEAPEKQVINK